MATQDRGKRNHLNSRTVKEYLLEINRIVFGDKKRGIPAQELTHKERLAYLANAAKFARMLNERDKAALLASKRSAFS